MYDQEENYNNKINLKIINIMNTKETVNNGYFESKVEEDKMNSYEVCKLLGLSPKGLNRLDLKIELRERRCRGENIIFHRFEREAIERAKTSKELAELKHNPRTVCIKEC
jgi:hypothetical protein